MTPFSRPGHHAVLFLCTGNFYRSRFAEALFNHHAATTGLAAAALSRGLRLDPRNDGPISRHVVEGLVVRGLDLPYPVRFPQAVHSADLVAADVVIALDESEHRPLIRSSFPAWEDAVRYWDVPDVPGARPGWALQRIEAHVLGLLAVLSRRDVSGPDLTAVGP